MSDVINEYYRYGIKDEDTGTITWGEWQSIGSNSDDSTEYMPVSGGTFTGGYFGTTVEVESTEIDVSKGSVFELSLSGDSTISFTGIPENVAACFSVVIAASNDITITWPESVKWSSNNEPTFTANTTTVLTFLTPNGGTTMYGSISYTEEES